MKYQLSKCVVEQISDNIFELIPDKGVVADKNYLDECWNLWDDLRDKPFGLLINLKNPYIRSFEGSRDMGKHPLTEKIAFFCSEDDHRSKNQLKLTEQIKISTGHLWNYQFFSDRDKAIEWLSDI